MRLLFIMLSILAVLIGCKGDKDLATLEEYYDAGKYATILAEYSSRNGLLYDSYKTLALLRLGRFEDIKLESDDGFFEAVKRFLRWRNCIYESEDCSIDISDLKPSKDTESAYRRLKEWIEELKSEDIDEIRMELSEAYRKMMEIQNIDGMNQMDLVKLKGDLNELFDRELSHLPESDIRVQLYRRILKEIDARLESISIGIDRPQN